MPLPTIWEIAEGHAERPPLADWMEENILLPRGFGRPGPLRLDPWQRQIADKMLVPGIREITLKLPSQTFKSLLTTATVMYAAVHGLTAILALPTETLRDRWIETKLLRFAPACPAFQAAVEWTRGGSVQKDGIRLRRGGMIPFATGGASGALQQVESQVIIIDEADAFRDDPFGRLDARGTSMPWAQVLDVSTPTISEDSLIDWRYGLSNECRPWVECPDCGEDTPLEWRPPDADADSSLSPLVCQQCACRWPWEYQQKVMPVWRPDHPEREDHWGFSASLLINSVTPWKEVVRRYHTWDAEDFSQQVLAEVYTQDMDKPPTAEESEHLFNNPEWEGRPARMLMVDVQRRNGGSLSVARLDVYGKFTEPRIAVLWQHEVFRLQRDWTDLWLEFRREVYDRERPDVMFADCGDYAGSDVVSIIEQVFPNECARGIVRHIRGDGARHNRFWGADPDVKGEVTVNDPNKYHDTLVLNVNGIKARLMAMVRGDRVALTGDRAKDYPPNVLEQLLSEKLVHAASRGEPKLLWRPIRRGIQNELWDQCVYALGGASYLGPDFRFWQSAEPDEEILSALYGPAQERSTGEVEERERAGEGELARLLEMLYPQRMAS